MARVLSLIFLVLCLSSPVHGRGTDFPIIGILTLPLPHAGCAGPPPSQSCAARGGETSALHILYVKWLEQAGLRVVPIQFDSPAAELDRLFAAVNGLFLTGGETPIWEANSTYDRAARHLFRRAIAANQAGDYFPVWGTCMGFQLLSVLVADDPSVLVRNCFQEALYVVPLQMTSAAASSRLFASDTLRQRLARQPTTVNLHHDGVAVDTYASNRRLAAFFRVLSTSADPLNRSFVSTVEGIRYPVYGVQWHPERPQFDWDIPDKSDTMHAPYTVEAMQWVATFFATEARKSEHCFASGEAESAALIYNYQARGHSSNQWYFFSPAEAPKP